jgi:AmmeMemoRadiSam system protein B
MMSSSDTSKLFCSKSEPIPSIRRDLQLIPIQDNGQSYIYFYDSMGYATPDFALDSSAGAIINLMDGRKSIEDLRPFLGDGITTDQLLEYIQFLDKNRVLHSEYFQQHSAYLEQQYEQSDIHQSATAGFSYPKKPEALKKYLHENFARANYWKNESAISDRNTIRALYAPHIDPRVGLESYAEAFSAISHLRPKRVVILATSHYAGLHPEVYGETPFIISSKDFDLPLGTIKTDKQGIRELLDKHGENETDAGITDRDRAHRMEHSIELHLLFLSYLWDHDFKIIPILVSSLEEVLYMKKGHRGQQLENFAKLINGKYGMDRETLFLISGDLSHIGKKFGDDQPAQYLFKEVKAFDRQFMDHASHSRHSKLRELMSESYDPYRICGFPPLYTFLKCMPKLKGDIINYDLWHEEERESAVSFGSILYHEE